MLCCLQCNYVYIGMFVCFVCFDALHPSQLLWLLGRSVGTGLGSNSLPLDLQSDTSLQSDVLPTVLHSPVIMGCN